MAAAAGQIRNTFENSGTVVNQVGQQIVHGNVIHQSLQGDDSLLNLLSTAAQATFNASNKQHDALCLSDTRVDLLRQITTWADGSHETCIFWLNGMAGTGKSTIARTIARNYYELERLGASFFFSRGGGDLSHAGKFFTSIAMQLAKKSSALKFHICEAISENKDISHQALRDQWKQLILKPLSKLKAESFQLPLILVIDALDECEVENDIRIILQLLAEAKNLRNIQLRIFVTSRPETPFRLGFYDIPEAEHHDFVLHNISPSIIDHDISIFFRHELKTVKRRWNLPEKWLTEDAIEHLVENAGGLFIWAATACRFITEGKKTAGTRLSLILEGDTTGLLPERKLDEIYARVLTHSIYGDYNEQEIVRLCELFQKIVGAIVVLYDSLSASALSDLLNLPKEQVNQTLEDLHSVLDVQESHEHPIRLLHPSFRDYLLNKQRVLDSRFWINDEEAHSHLLHHCLQLMSNVLRRNICRLPTPGFLISEINGSKLNDLPVHVQYACQYWIDHLQRSRVDLCDNGQVQNFLQEHFLHWLEALSLMGKISEGVLMISALHSMLRPDKHIELLPMVHDAKRFILKNRSIVEIAPLQVYNSALVFSPEKSMIRRRYSDQVPAWIKSMVIVEENWSPLLQTLEGHSRSVIVVAFSSGGRLLASGSDDGTVRLWNPATGTSCSTLKDHSDSVRTLAFSPNDQLLASGSMDCTIRLWDPMTGAERGTLTGHWNSVNVLAFSPNGDLLASGSRDSTVRLWKPTTRELYETLRGHSDWVSTLAFSPNGHLLASGSRDCTIRLWDLTTRTSLSLLIAHTNWVRTLTFLSGGRLLASGSDDPTIRLWDVTKGVLCGTLRGHLDWISIIVASLDGNLLTSGSGDGTIRLWNPTTGGPCGILKGHSDSIRTLAFSPDGQLLASGSNDRTIRLWNPITKALYGVLEGHTDWIRTLTFSPDSSILASGSNDRTVRLWDLTVEPPQDSIEDHSDSITTVAFSPDGQLLASGSKNSTITVWNPTIGSLCRTLEGHSDSVKTLTFSPNGTLLTSGSDDGTIKLWNPAIGSSCGTLKGHSDSIRALTFSPNGNILASSSDDRTVKLWDPTTEGATRTLASHDDLVKTFLFSPDDQLLATGSCDGTVRLWNSNSRVPCGILMGHSSSVETLAFSPSGQLLASGSIDCTVKLWNPITGIERDTLTGHRDLISVLIFSPNGHFLASGSKDSTVRLWKSTTGELFKILEYHSNWASTLVFSPDSHFLAAGSHTDTVMLWDTTTGEPSDSVAAYVFSPDGQLLATGSCDGTVRLWKSNSRILCGILIGHLRSVETLAFSPNSQLLASGSMDCTVKLWNPTTGIERGTLTGHRDSISVLIFSSNGDLLASGSRDRTIKLWKSTTGELFETLKSHSDWVSILAFSPDDHFLASRSRDGTINTWNLTERARIMSIDLNGELIWVSVSTRLFGGLFISPPNRIAGKVCNIYKDHLRSISVIAISSGGHVLAAGSGKGEVHIWDLVKGIYWGSIAAHDEPVTFLEFSAHGNILTSISNDGTVKQWDPIRLDTSEIHSDLVGTLPNNRFLGKSSKGRFILQDLISTASHSTLAFNLGGTVANPLVSTPAFVPDGRLVASGSNGHGTWLCDLTGGASWDLNSHSDSITASSFSPDGRLFALGAHDGMVWVCDPVTRELSGTFEGHSDSIKTLAFSPDNQFLASGSSDRTVRLWDPKTGASRGTLEGHSSDVSALAFSPNGHLLASRSDHYTIKLWDTTTGASCGALQGRSELVKSLTFSPDGNLLTSASDDGTAKLWDIEAGKLVERLGDESCGRTLSFDADSTRFDMGREQIEIETPSFSPVRRIPAISYSVDVTEQWVTWKGHHVLWLPVDRRPSTHAVRDNVLALGHGSGRLTFIQFDQDIDPLIS